MDTLTVKDLKIWAAGTVVAGSLLHGQNFSLEDARRYMASMNITEDDLAVASEKAIRLIQNISKQVTQNG